jgi:hypothetical protein
MTKQNLRNCCKLVVDTIKKLVAATNHLSTIQKESSTTLEESPKAEGQTTALIQQAKVALLSLNKLKHVLHFKNIVTY